MIEKIKILAITTSIILLSACASTYTPDPQAPHATLGVKNFYIFGTTLLGIYEDANQCKGMQVQGQITLNGKPRPITANRLITFVVMRRDRLGGPDLHFFVSFVPESGRTYLVETTVSHARTTNKKAPYTITGTMRLLEEQFAGGKITYKAVPYFNRTFHKKENPFLPSFSPIPKAIGYCDSLMSEKVFSSSSTIEYVLAAPIYY